MNIHAHLELDITETSYHLKVAHVQHLHNFCVVPDVFPMLDILLEDYEAFVEALHRRKKAGSTACSMYK